MNSLNILSSRVIGQSANSGPPRNRSHSQGDASPATLRGDLAKARSFSEHEFHFSFPEGVRDRGEREGPVTEFRNDGTADFDEKTPLLYELQKTGIVRGQSRLFIIAQRLFDALAETLKVILSTLAAPGVYAAQCFRDETGHYTPMVPLKKLRRSIGTRDGDDVSSRSKKNLSMRGKGESAKSGKRRDGSSRKLRSSSSQESIASSTSESDGDRRALGSSDMVTTRHTRSKSHSSDLSTDDNTPRRSIRIKLHNEDALQRQKKRSQSADVRQSSYDDDPDTEAAALAAESLKSPTSPSSHHRMTKYPHAPAPPRPLVPLRQPSYTMWTTGRNASKVPQKTLVLDLDETLIHSLAKGGRMSSGHMVEVKLATPMSAPVAPGEPPATLGPQHPILYYVHKRPHCDEFLRKICKWYKLVVFTASVQEYADPVIDWLEQERKYFQARYYRQHCTLRNGAYIKDLSSVEPDLSKVMILDNSPMSYIFHEGESITVVCITFLSIRTDNAIPIKGWISDPTDHGLLNLIPMLEALQYVTDVRAFLALRRGEAES